MTLLDLEPANSHSLLMKLVAFDDGNVDDLSFAELLKKVKFAQKNQDIQNGMLAFEFGKNIQKNNQNQIDMHNQLPIHTSKIDEKIEVGTKIKPKTKKEQEKLELMKLLGVKDVKATKQIKKDEIVLNKEITQHVGIEELKVIILHAKTYIKNQILHSNKYITKDVKHLPKTLKGLVELAKKLKINITKITLEEIKLPKKAIANLENKALHVEDSLDVKKTSKQVVTKHKIIQHVEIKDDLKDMTKLPIFTKKTLHQEHTTQQLVQTKMDQNLGNCKKEKDIQKDALQSLLKTKKTIQSKDQRMTPDFSVDSAKVDLSSKKTQTPLEEIRHLLGDVADKKEHKQNPSCIESKTSTIEVRKSDDLKVKIKEAKQMIKYLSKDVKNAIDNYKAPFTRLKVQLHPKTLGEVDLVVVQRGKNLHVNITSNNNAINALSLNANELKIQLQNNGVNNATLNFNSHESSQEQTKQQQKNKQQQAKDEYGYFETQENEENISKSLEIVIPHYA